MKVGGIFYGTTEAGGINCPRDNPSGCGTVFSFDPGTDTETVVYSFGTDSGCDGKNPAASVLAVGGTLYGTTEGGHCKRGGTGTVFAVPLQ